MTHEQQITHIINNAEMEIYLATGKCVKLTTHDTNTISTIDMDSVTALLHIIAKSMGMGFNDYSIRNRKTKYVYLRYLGIIFLKRFFLGIKSEHIGAIYKQDRTTIVTNTQVAKNLLETKNDEFINLYNNASMYINSQIKNHKLCLNQNS